MVDTPRNQSDILTLLADNTSGAISAQDLRDYVVSAPFYERTAAEISASVVPTEYRYPPCNVLRYGAVGDGTTDDLAAFDAAVAVAGSSASLGRRIEIPFSASGYFLNGTWDIDKCVLIDGVNSADHHTMSGSLLKFPADTDGIRIYNGTDSPSTPQEGTHTTIRNIVLRANSQVTSGRGIYATTVFKIEFCTIRNFKGVGIEIFGDTVNGIADNWWMSNVIIRDCGGDGLWLHGDDAQVGTAINCQFMNNGGWGVNNDAPYTNIFIGCQSSGNTSGSFSDSTTMSYQGLVLIGCYVEAGAGADTDLDESSVVIASGTLGWDSRGSYFGNVAPGTGIACPQNGLIIFAADSGSNTRDEKFRLDTATGYVSGPVQYTVGSTGTILGDTRMTVAVAGTSDTENYVINNGNGKVGSIHSSGNQSTFFPQSAAGFNDTNYTTDGWTITRSGTSDTTVGYFRNANGLVGSIHVNGTQSIFYPNSGTSGTYYGDQETKLLFAGTAAHKLAVFHNDNGEVGSIETSGTATAFNTSSDYRLKENVQPATGTLGLVNQLKPVSFDWKAGGEGFGFLAHELQEHVPAAVSGEKDGEAMQQVDHSKLVPYLVAAIQELSAEIERLKG